MKYSITKDGVALNKSLYTLDKETRTFSSTVDGLVLDFSDEDAWTFKTSSGCTFTTGSGCTFTTGSGCTFTTDSDCVVVRRDVYEVIELEAGVKIKLNDYKTKGFTKVDNSESIEIESKTYTIDEIREALLIILEEVR
ncbi:hypothetical protein H0W80_00150 [Candidatus Saccharibacteria bacterium]|nr:hypothetical protein [Candidatus Saccharibacteria bacterium]